MKKSKWIVTAVLSGVMLTPAAFAGERGPRAKKVGALSFRLASMSATSGFQPQRMQNGQMAYLTAEDAFTADDITNIETRTSNGGQVMMISLAPGVSERLAMRASESGADAVAIIRGGRVISTGPIASIGVDVMSISRLSAAEVKRITRVLTPRSVVNTATVVSVVPRQNTVLPGDMITFDVYVSNVASLRTYQFALQVTSNDTGRLVRDHGVVDQSVADFVFSGRQVLQAVDEIHGRFGAVVFQGTANTTERKYLGSYTYQVSQDAAGSFTISIAPGSISFLNDDAGEDIPFRISSATVTVG